jgi:hypothetical protein
VNDKQTPPDWVIREAEKRAGINLPFPAMTYNNGGAFAALCDMIERYEQPPVDRKVLCAREAMVATLTNMIDNAVKAEREAIAKWLRAQWEPGCWVDYDELADCVTGEVHLT